jgi:hypothetical protein
MMQLVNEEQDKMIKISGGYILHNQIDMLPLWQLIRYQRNDYKELTE